MLLSFIRSTGIFYGRMMDSSLIHITELFPGDAARKLCMRRRKSQRAALCQSKPDPLMSQSVYQFAGQSDELSLLSFNHLQEIEEWRASLLQFSFYHHSSFYLFPERVGMFICMFWNVHSFFFLCISVPSWGNAIYTHTSDVLHLSLPARQPPAHNH